MCVKRVLHFLLFLPVLLFTSGWQGVAAMQVYTSGRVQAVNGTDVRLKCTFQSSHPIKRSTLTISWSFRPLRPGNEETVFYFHEKAFPPSEGRFQKKVVFVGDVLSSDASILVRDVMFSYNGTFSCQVKNPPDVHGNVGEIQLRVVASAPFSEIVILAVAIGGAVLLAIVILAICMFVRQCRKMKRMEQERVPQERKDLVVW
ncbi:myelin protein zero-like protein 2 [Ictalurus furcatus]|uniref:myelin protein zero-like protein 2 n=1 Tax=Ictalurus furcatus TaxID=66913 RepID=UPI002350AD19|nr:myelin protein zero-like protein 2 [Ictalurus furcatus]